MNTYTNTQLWEADCLVGSISIQTHTAQYSQIGIYYVYYILYIIHTAPYPQKAIYILFQWSSFPNSQLLIHILLHIPYFQYTHCSNSNTHTASEWCSQRICIHGSMLPTTYVHLLHLCPIWATTSIPTVPHAHQYQ